MTSLAGLRGLDTAAYTIVFPRWAVSLTSSALCFPQEGGGALEPMRVCDGCKARLTEEEGQRRVEDETERLGRVREQM